MGFFSAFRSATQSVIATAATPVALVADISGVALVASIVTDDPDDRPWCVRTATEAIDKASQAYDELDDDE